MTIRKAELKSLVISFSFANGMLGEILNTQSLSTADSRTV